MGNATDLHVHSTYSVYDGFGSVKSVVQRAVELGWDAVALTEHGHMMSAPSLYQEAKKAGIKPIIGSELYVTTEEDLIDGDKTVLAEKRHLTVLALSFEGYQNLVRWQNESMMRPLYYNGNRISLERMVDIAPHPLHHNVILSGCMGGELCQCILQDGDNSEAAAQLYIEACASIFPNFYIELQNHGISKFMEMGMNTYDKMVEQQHLLIDRLLPLAQKTGVPVIVTNDSHYQTPGQRRAHMAMMARKQHRRSTESHRDSTTEDVATNFAMQYGYWGNYMRPLEVVASSLPKWAEEQSIASVHAIVAESNVVLDPLDKFVYSIPRSGYEDPVAEIRSRSRSRLKGIFNTHGQVALDRFEFELDTMGEFAHYLLIYANIIKMARDSGIYTWTRGSAANSLVVYCLGIHDIDPIHYKLLFERFINPARKKLPDIDIDIEGNRRDDVVKLTNDYLSTLEGENNVRGICTYSTLANRATFRLMAESAGVPTDKVDELAKILPQMIDSGMVESEEEAYEQLREELGIDIYSDAAQMFDSIGSISQHACAFALGTESRQLADWVPLYRIGSSDTLVTQYNMDSIEKMGFLKLDLLRLDTLSILHAVARMLGKDMRWLDQILKDGPGTYGAEDEPTNELLRTGRTEGVHSFQGGTQRRGCIEVGIQSDHDCVAVQALYRPSGTRTGFDKLYVDRKHQRSDYVRSKNTIVAEVLEETHGLPIYQEQIMEIGAKMGMSGEEIDDLYKAIKTAKGIGRGAAELFEAFKPTFMHYAEKDANSLAAAESDWKLFDAFQGYGFNRGHATSYALLGRKCAYIAAHHPQEFFTALLDKYPDNPRYISGAIGAGYKFEPPDVNKSQGGFTVGDGANSIRVGLLRVRGLGPGAVGEIVRNQPFASLDDLRERTNSNRVDKTVIENLARIGALASIGIQRTADEDPDVTDFEVLKFVLRKPMAFRGVQCSIPSRASGSWQFLGRQRGVEITEGKAFVAKLFWVPPKDDILVTKSSAMGHYNAHLLTVIDENGIPFDLIVNEKKEVESELAKLIAEEGQGAVIAAEGQVRMPFLRNGNPGFGFWGIVGAKEGQPLIWHTDDEFDNKVSKLAAKKQQQTRRAA